MLVFRLLLEGSKSVFILFVIGNVRLWVHFSRLVMNLLQKSVFLLICWWLVQITIRQNHGFGWIFIVVSLCTHYVSLNSQLYRQDGCGLVPKYQAGLQMLICKTRVIRQNFGFWFGMRLAVHETVGWISFEFLVNVNLQKNFHYTVVQLIVLHLRLSLPIQINFGLHCLKKDLM